MTNTIPLSNYSNRPGSSKVFGNDLKPDSQPSLASARGPGILSHRTHNPNTMHTRFSLSTREMDGSNQESLYSTSRDLSGNTPDREGSSDTESIVSTARHYFISRVNRRPAPLKSGGLGKEFWMKDENATECFGCSTTFTSKCLRLTLYNTNSLAFRRKHHCRICGQIFCSSCTLLISGEKFNQKGKMRVCKNCTKVIEKLDSSDEEDGEDQFTEYSESLNIPETINSDGQSQHHRTSQPEVSFGVSPRHSHRYLPRDDQFSDSDFHSNVNLYSDEDDFPKALTKIRKHESQSRSPSRSRNSFRRHRSGTSLSIDQGKSNIMRIGQRKKSFSMSHRPSGMHVPSFTSQVALKPPLDLSKASVNHAKAFSKQLLQSYGLDTNLDKWIKALMPPLIECAANIDLDIKGGDNIDIRHYVKLKRIPGGSPSHSRYVDGIVFSQSLSFKSMPQTITNPRILLANALFENPRLHVTKLFEIAKQENSRFDTIIQRVAQLQPHIILSTGYASRTIIKRLDQMGVAVVSNVKTSVINRIARYTQASISTYETLRSSTRLGSCSKFEVKTYRHNNTAKKYLFFSGTPKQLGCTIVLRGADMDVLAAVKAVVTFMVFVVFHLKLETSLLQDLYAFVPSTPTQGKVRSITIGSPSKKAIADAPKPEDTKDEFANDLVRYHTDNVLSASPFVQFGSPYLLRVARGSEDKLVAMDEGKEMETLKAEIRSMLNADCIESNLKYLPEGHDTIQKMADFLYHQRYQRLYEMWSREKRQWEVSHSMSPDMFDPFTHQYIVLLYSLVCTETATPCVSPELQVIHFYNKDDITLGQFVEEICMSAPNNCQDNCGKPMKDHFIKYVHGNGSIIMTVSDLPCSLPGMQDSILMWSSCKICNNSTPILPMSDATWKYSLGKYFELCFWSTKLSVRDDVCSHDLFRDHVRFFGWHNMAVRLEYKDIELYEISVPTTQLTWDPEREMKLKVQCYSGILEKINSFYASVEWRLNSVNIDELVLEKSDACQTRVDELLKKAEDERNTLLAELSNLYISTKPTSHLPLNGTLRSVQKLVVNWDVEFAEFESNFFPSEKDITRITAQHLKRLFERPSEDEKRSQLNSSNESTLNEKQTLEAATPEAVDIPESALSIGLDGESEKLNSLPGSEPDTSAEMEQSHEEFKNDKTETTGQEEEAAKMKSSKSDEASHKPQDSAEGKKINSSSEQLATSQSSETDAAESPTDTVKIDDTEALGSRTPSQEESNTSESSTKSKPEKTTSDRVTIQVKKDSDRGTDSSTDPEKVNTDSDKPQSALLKAAAMAFRKSPDLSAGEDNFFSPPSSKPGTRSSSPKRDGRVQEVISRLMEGQQTGHHERKFSHMSDISFSDSIPESQSRDEMKDVTRSKSPIKARAGLPILKPHVRDRRPSQSNSPEKVSIIEQKLSMRSRIPQMKQLEDSGVGPSSGFTYRRNYGDKISIPPPSLAGPMRQRLPRELENHMLGRFGNNNTKVSVSSLAKHFEQLSKDFEKERARERRLLAQARFRAFPVAPSKVIVEVYDTVNEAVKEEMQSEGETSDEESSNDTPTATTKISNGKKEAVTAGDAQRSESRESTEANDQKSKLDPSESSTFIDNETETQQADGTQDSGIKDEDFEPSRLSRHESDVSQPSVNFPAKENTNASVNLLQALASFWADRSATGWKPLEYPL